MSRKELTAGLVMLTEVFAVDMPTETAIDLYAMAFEDVPAHAFQLGLKALIKTHKWPRMPLPADLLAHANPITVTLRLHLTRVERAQSELTRLT